MDYTLHLYTVLNIGKVSRISSKILRINRIPELMQRMSETPYT